MGANAESTWLLNAPPWRDATDPSDRRKRNASQISQAERTLGKLASSTAVAVEQMGWANFVEKARGKSNLADEVGFLPHKAARLLDHLRKRGASVVTSPAPWGTQRCDDAVQRGPHKSSHEEREFVAKEILDFCAQGYWAVLPYQLVRHWRGLRISPLGVVPQRYRRPRLIVDYSFSGLNNDTIPLAPKDAMQFGRALQRVMTTIVNADPRYGPVYLSKIDIADGFYRVWLQLSHIAKLGVALPTAPGEPHLVAFPLALPMGWVESPPTSPPSLKRRVTSRTPTCVVTRVPRP